MSMKKTLKSLLAIGATIALLGAGCAPGAQVDSQGSAEAVVNTFMTAVQNKDKEGAKAVTDMEGDFGQHFDDAWMGLSAITLTEFKVTGVEGNEVTVDLTVEEDGNTDSSTETFEVRQDANGKFWLVEP